MSTQNQHNHNEHKIRVLVATHVGEPIGGIAINYRTLLESSYVEKLNVEVVETSRIYLNFDKNWKIKVTHLINALLNIFVFLFYLWKFTPDIVHIGTASRVSFAKHGIMALFSHWSGVKVVLQVHASMARLIPQKNTFWRRYVLFVLRRMDGIVTLSTEWASLIDLLPDVPVCYIPNAINVQPYKVLPRPRPNQVQVNILFLGHIGQEKGCFDLVYAIDQLRRSTTQPFCMHFVGETLYAGEKERLQVEVKKLNLDDYIQIHPPEYDHAKISRLADSDILVLPSYFEGMPMSVIEAMAAGLPVVATRIGGIPDQIIHQYNGFLINPGDVRALSHSLQALLENPKERLQMGLNGREVACEKFDIETKTNNLIDFYQSILK